MSQQYISLEDLKIHERLVIQESMSSLIIEKLNGFEKRFSEIDKKFEKIDEKFEKIDEKFSHLEAGMTGIKERMSRMEGLITHLPTSLQLTSTTIATVISVAGILVAAIKYFQN